MNWFYKIPWIGPDLKRYHQRQKEESYFRILRQNRSRTVAMFMFSEMKAGSDLVAKGAVKPVRPSAVKLEHRN